MSCHVQLLFIKNLDFLSFYSHYVQAVIYEGIRMRPPLLGLFPKVVPAPGETFHGKFIPAGTSICTNGASLQRSKALFGEDADIYNPERFMALESPEDRKEMERNVELVFGYGQWMCAGKSIAFMELNKVIFEVFSPIYINSTNMTAFANTKG